MRTNGVEELEQEAALREKGDYLMWEKVEEWRKCKSGECSTSVCWAARYYSQGVVCMEEQLMSKHIGIVTTHTPFSYDGCLHWLMWNIAATIGPPSDIGVYHQSDA
jgi:hypothetical protein